MAPINSLSLTVPGHDLPGATERDTDPVIWLRGEHDISTVAELSAALAQAITLDDADVVVDLTDMQYMGVATVDVIRRARELLRARSRGLVLRSPPRCVRRVLELCGEYDLLALAEATPFTRTAGALRSWVRVPTIERPSRPSRPSRPGRPGRPVAASAGAADPVNAGLLPAVRMSSAVADHRDKTAASGRRAP